MFIVYAAADEAFVRGYLLDTLGLPDDRVLRIANEGERRKFLTDLAAVREPAVRGRIA